MNEEKRTLADAFREERPLKGSIESRLIAATKELNRYTGQLLMEWATEGFCQTGGMARHMTKTQYVTYKNAIPPSGPASNMAQAADVAVRIEININPAHARAQKLT